MSSRICSQDFATPVAILYQDFATPVAILYRSFVTPQRRDIGRTPPRLAQAAN